jgi:hypothetical protein
MGHTVSLTGRTRAVLTVDFLTDVAFSRPFGYLKNNVDTHGYIKDLDSR